MATAVLVHGAWHGAWCFERVLALLHEQGIDAVAVDLPGHGDDPGPFTDLHGDAARVTAVLDRLDDDVVLLGHSYGGAAITEAGVHPKVSHLVYLCAFALTEHESCNRAATDDPAVDEISHEGRPSLRGALVRRDDGTTTLTADGGAACLYNDCDADTVAWATARLGPQPMENLRQSPPPEAIAWRSTPSTYVVCEHDLMVHPDLQRILARRCTESVAWNTDHSPFLSRPELVANLVADLVTGVGAEVTPTE